MHFLKKQLAFIGMIGLAATLCGCGQKPDSTEKSSSAETKKVDTHSEWWCNEHGVPEEICGQCHEKIAAELQKKGDWCKEHKRPDSQCFKCHPELEAKFAATYEAKYNKKPPKPE